MLIRVHSLNKFMFHFILIISAFHKEVWAVLHLSDMVPQKSPILPSSFSLGLSQSLLESFIFRLSIILIIILIFLVFLINIFLTFYIYTAEKISHLFLFFFLFFIFFLFFFFAGFLLLLPRRNRLLLCIRIRLILRTAINIICQWQM